MATDINMSLDDIIKKSKSLRNFNSRKKQTNGNTNSRRNLNGGRTMGASGGNKSGFGGPKFRNTNRNRPAARFSPYKRGDIDSPWSHDLYEDSDYNIGISKRMDPDGTKVIISNLEFGVTDSDLEELFLEIGSLTSCEIHYDKSGRSLGSGSVVFENRIDAVRAINQYNGIPLDGRPMKLEVASSNTGRIAETRRLGNFRNRNLGGGGGGSSGGGGGGRRRNSGGRSGGFGNRSRRNDSTLSAEQLDAELDEYRARAL